MMILSPQFASMVGPGIDPLKTETCLSYPSGASISFCASNQNCRQFSLRVYQLPSRIQTNLFCYTRVWRYIVVIGVDAIVTPAIPRCCCVFAGLGLPMVDTWQGKHGSVRACSSKYERSQQHIEYLTGLSAKHKPLPVHESGSMVHFIYITCF